MMLGTDGSAEDTVTFEWTHITKDVCAGPSFDKSVSFFWEGSGGMISVKGFAYHLSKCTITTIQ
eukprot:4295579-Ditylum_brightwellii.AAC.1